MTAGERRRTIRLATAGDAAALLALQRRLDVQSAFMLLEPDERDESPARLRERLGAQTAAGSFDLLAEQVGDAGAPPGQVDDAAAQVGAPAQVGDAPRPALVGWLAVGVSPYRRAAHVGHLVLGVDAAHAGRGVGGDLLTAAAREAGRRSLRRLELTVMTDNLRALDLYLRHGFTVEGLRRHALLRDSVPVDEYHMARLLPGG